MISAIVASCAMLLFAFLGIFELCHNLPYRYDSLSAAIMAYSLTCLLAFGVCFACIFVQSQTLIAVRALTLWLSMLMYGWQLVESLSILMGSYKLVLRVWTSILFVLLLGIYISYFIQEVASHILCICMAVLWSSQLLLICFVMLRCNRLNSWSRKNQLLVGATSTLCIAGVVVVLVSSSLVLLHRQNTSPPFGNTSQFGILTVLCARFTKVHRDSDACTRLSSQDSAVENALPVNTSSGQKVPDSSTWRKKSAVAPSETGRMTARHHNHVSQIRDDKHLPYLAFDENLALRSLVALILSIRFEDRFCSYLPAQVLKLAKGNLLTADKVILVSIAHEFCRFPGMSSPLPMPSTALHNLIVQNEWPPKRLIERMDTGLGSCSVSTSWEDGLKSLKGLCKSLISHVAYAGHVHSDLCSADTTLIPSAESDSFTIYGVIYSIRGLWTFNLELADFLKTRLNDFSEQERKDFTQKAREIVGNTIATRQAFLTEFAERTCHEQDGLWSDIFTKVTTKLSNDYDRIH